jgi:hypothetical protein
VRALPIALPIALVCLVAYAIAVTGPARADVNAVTVSPAQATVSVTGGSLSLTWQVRRSEAPPQPVVTTPPPTTGPTGAPVPSAPVVTTPAPVPVADTTRSSEVVVEVDGRRVLTLPRALSRTSSLLQGSSETLLFRETLSLPLAVARAIAEGRGVATVTRTFADSGGAASASARVSVSGQLDLTVLRVDLQFDRGTRTQVVARDEGLRAVADVRIGGTGQLVAEWRISLPDALRGGEALRVLGLVRRPLMTSGSGRVRLVSPPLPTDVSGLFEVSLAILQPDTGREAAAIRYFVTPAALPPMSEIDLLGPPEGAGLTENTRFAWQGVAGAAAYQLEIYPDGGTGSGDPPASPLLLGDTELGVPPLSGRVVGAEETATRLTRLSLRHLPPGADYRWRVRAIGPAGETLAVSPLRRVER